uniref:Small ribosomal subunit protein uS10 n=1 Tax=candidate division WOR-3 bacterium TaxID=2052148 RepID=A0A7C4TAU9_UNCW3
MNRLRIRLKSYDHRVLDQSVKSIVDTAKRFGINISGPVPLPTERSLYTVLRSPHVDKKSREQFELRIHKRLIELNDVTPDVIDALNKLEIPAGVYVEVKAV